MSFTRISSSWVFAPALAWTGGLIALLLAFRQTNTVFCGGDELGHVSPCDAVVNSVYSKIGGVPLSIIGLAAYAVLFVGFVAILFLQPSPWRSRLTFGLRAIVLVGAICSAGLVGLQAFELHAFCPLCCASAACFFALAALVLVSSRQRNEANAVIDGCSRFSIVLAAAIPLFITLGVLLTVLTTNKPSTADTTKVLATVDGQPITDNDLPTSLRLSIQPLEEDAAKLRQDWLDQHLDELVLEREAKKEGVSSKDVLAQQTAHVPKASDAEISGWRNEHKDEPDLPNEEIVARLKLSKESNAENAYLADLRKLHSAIILVHPPTPPLVHFDLSHAQLDGPPNAPAVFVVFSDFECPFCRQLGGNLRAVRKKLGDRVAIAFKNMPLEAIHPKAHAFALAAIAAGEQNKFWEYHDALISQNLATDDATLTNQARILGLDVPKFTESLHSKRVADHLQADVQEAASLGLQDTPTLFLNGKLSGGLHSTDELIRLVQ